MITFSRVLVNPRSRGGRRLLTDPQALHAAVRACFPPDIDESAARVLWRLDHDGYEHTLYVVGPEEPDLRVIVDQAGWSTRPGESADYEPLLDSLVSGQERRFRLVANPVRSLAPAPGARRGKVVPHVTPAQQSAWLVDRAPRHGFEIRSAGGADGQSPDVVVDRRADLRFGRRDASQNERGRVTLRTARFEGTLRVTDPGALRAALTHGIGRGRAYGCGLLTLARIHA